MQEIRRRVVDRLKDPVNDLYPDLVPGGVWDRALKRGETSPGNTNSAFYKDPGGIVRLHRTIVVIGPNEVEPVDGPRRGEAILRNGFLRLFYFVEATSSGKEALDQIDVKVWSLLHDHQETLSTGYPMTLSALEMTEPVDSEWEGSLVCMRRFLAEYLRPT